MRIFKPKGKVFSDKDKAPERGSENLGRIAASCAGRDKGKYFVITRIIDESYVYAANGTDRKVRNPKKKNLRHLSLTGERVPPGCITSQGVALDDGQIEEILKKYNSDSLPEAAPDI